MPIVVPQRIPLSEETKETFQTLLYIPELVGSPRYEEFLEEVGRGSILLNVLVDKYLSRGSLREAQAVHDDMIAPPLSMTRELIVKGAEERNEIVHPPSIPPEQWDSDQPFLFERPFEGEWYAGCVQFVLEGEAILRVKKVVQGKIQYGTIIVEESKFPRPPEEGEFVEAALHGKIWVIRFHDHGT
jgi:hypothetical protein